MWFPGRNVIFFIIIIIIFADIEEMLLQPEDCDI